MVSPKYIITSTNIHANTLVELLRKRAKNQPDRQAYIFFKDGETKEVSLTYAQLDQRVCAIAAKLQDIITIGDRVLLLYPSGLLYIIAFLGCLYAGVIAVPAYPPRRNRSDIRLQTIVKNAQAKIVLTQNDIFSHLTEYLTYIPELNKLHWLVTDNLVTEFAKTWQVPAIDSNTLAFLQYTSGSTNTPKGVMINHSNLLYNEKMLQQGFGHTEKTIGVGWLPLFHDMGLIGNVLQPLYVGFPIVIMSPITFLQQPNLWLQTISCYKATSSGGPNFAYDLCVNKITAEQKEKLDLSNWEVAFNGAETIHAETLDRFFTAFKTCGFRKEAFYPCYGMAETTLFISGSLKAMKPMIFEVKKAALEQHLVEIVSDGKSTQKIVGCGQTWLDQKILIVDPKTFIPCSDQQVGEIWVSGPNVAQGYWNQPKETEQTFNAYLANSDQGPFLRTGDLGFLKEGELFVTGRLKDIIIIKGRNYYPQDIELNVGKSHPALNARNCAVFSVERKNEERLVVIQEVKRIAQQILEVDEVVNIIRQAVLEQHELQVYAILLLKPMTIPKTSSGKIQRHMCKAGFLDGTLETVASWQQKISIMQQTSAKALQLLHQLKTTTSLEQYRILLPIYLQERIAVVLELPINQIDNKKNLIEIGLDSQLAVELNDCIMNELNVTIPVAMFLENTNLEYLAELIVEQWQKTPTVINIPN